MRLFKLAPLVTAIALAVSPPMTTGRVASASASVPIGCSGTWSVEPSPNVGQSDNLLSAVSALSPTDVWAVGDRFHVGQPRALTEHWDGVAWRVIETPLVGAVQLQGVAAITSSDVWAVGYRWGGTPVAIHWDGSSWTQSAIPRPGIGSYLLAVSGTSSTDVWATGFVQFTGGQSPFMLHWNGGTWKQFPAPAISSRNTVVYAVAALNGSDAWAVGNSFGTNPDQIPYVIHWDGASWHWAATPTGPSEFLTAVSGSGSNDVWIVGDATVSGVTDTLTLHWDGARWSVVPSPDPGTVSHSLWAVDAASPDRAWAAGWYTVDLGIYPLILVWDGSTWSVDPSPLPNPSNVNQLLGVSADSTSDAWAAGHFVDPVRNAHSTLTEHRCE